MSNLTPATLAVAALAMLGGVTAAVASADGGRDHPEDTPTTTTTTTTTTAPAAPGTATRRAPLIRELEVDDAPGGRIRLRAEVVPRGAAVTRVRFTYRGRTLVPTRTGRTWASTVVARGGDERDNARISFRVRACAGTLCATRTGSDEA